MKKLRILFLAVLAAALAVSGAFAADKLPSGSFDVTKVSNGEKASTADGLVSVDLWSPDKTLTVSLDVPAGYEITWKDVSGYTVTSADGKVYATLTVPSTASSGDKFAITFTLTSTDSGSSSEEEASYTYNTSTKYQFAYAGTAGKVAYYTLEPIEIANELDSTYPGKYYTMTETEGVQTYTEADGEPDKNNNGNYWRVTVDDTADKLTIPATADGTTYALDKGDGTYQAVDNFEQGDADNKYHKVTVFNVNVDNVDLTGKYEKSSAGVYTVTTKTGKQENGEFFTISTEEADIITVKAEVTYALNEEKTYTTATKFTPSKEYVVITTEQGLLYASLGDKWDENVTGNSNKRYATAAYDDDTVTYTVVDTTVVTKPQEGVTYFVITPKAAEITKEADITAGDKFIGNEAAGTYTPATEWITEGTLTFPAYDKDTKYVTILSSKDVTSEVTNDNFSKGIYYKYDSSTGHFSRDTDAYSTKNKYFRLAVSEWKVVAAADLVEGTDYYTSADADPAIEETKEESAVFDEMTLRQSYAAADAAKSYTLTLTVTYRDKASTDGSSSKTAGTPGIDWYDSKAAYPFNNKTWMIYLSADKAGDVQTTTAVKVSSDFTATPVFVISPDKSDYVKFTIGTATPKTASADTYNKVYTFDITATPVASTDTKGVGFTAYVTVTSGSKVVSNDALDFTVIVSDDTKTTSGDSTTPGDTVITSWDLTVTADKTAASLTYYEKSEVTITARPADDGVDFVITNDADESDGYTLESDDGNFSTTGYVVKYTFTAGETEDEFPITFTVKATSGDTTQTETVTVTFTVAYDKDKAATVKPEEPTDLADELGATDGNPKEYSVGGHTFHIYSENDRKAMFAEGKGIVGWGVRAPFKVRKVFGPLGWWFRFLNAVANAYFDLNAPTVFGAGVASIAADDGVASRDAALTVGFEGDDTAFFELDLEKAAATLPEGATYQANSSYTPDATADDEGAQSDPMTAGELKGAKSSSGGGEQGGGDQGGDEGKEAIDNVLGGTGSGGCDAGFGALALALAASMIFVRKRS